MRFFYIVRTGLHLYPPCLNQINYLRELNHEVIAIYGSCNQKTEESLHDIGVKTIGLSIKRSSIKYLGKVQSYTDYKNRVLRVLSENFESGDFVWYGTADSCFSLGNEHKKYPFILNVLELYDNNTFYRKGVGRVISDASAVIACESTRADIMKMWWKLKETPYVMPNKPYCLPDRIGEGTIDETKVLINQIKNKKVFLYQGIISSDRNLGLLADAFAKLNNSEIYLGLMGQELTNSVDDLKKMYPRTIYLGYVPAPYHLEVTGNAFAGVAYYQGNCLNNLFCAPNKIYEYSGLGLPILCNDMPGLRNTVKHFGAGECVNFENQNELMEAIGRIVEHRETYSQNSHEMYNAVDNKSTMIRILSDIM